MKVDLNGIALPQGLDPVVGNLYVAKGGRGNTAYWLVIALNSTNGCVMLGLDPNGNVVSSASYNRYVMKTRQLVGFVKDLDKLVFELESK
jgi:hypothetical protein